MSTPEPKTRWPPPDDAERNSADAASPGAGETARQGGEDTRNRRRIGSLIDWFLDQDLLRGPHLFVDYWANVLSLRGIVPERQVKDGLIEPTLFRAGLDRPDFQVPRLRFYILLFLLGPLLFPLRTFRRLGRYRMRLLGSLGKEVQEALGRYRLTLKSTAPGRVDVGLGDTRLAADVIDPHLVSGFCSLFWAAYKLPLATFSAILIVAIAPPLLQTAGLRAVVTDYWLPVGFPLIVLLLFAVYREWVTAVLGAIPVLLGRPLFAITQPSTVESWFAFIWPLLALFALYLIFDWFFMPRPVPPVLLLYTVDGPGRPYERRTDSPYWLEGKSYWVWRYLILSRAELNKFWERDWERVDLWIRADGEDAGMLEWVVTDLHYRELWTPYDRLGHPEALERYRQHARRALDEGEPGVWLVEVDADRIFHYPFFRGAAFIPERGAVPVRSTMDLISAFWRRARDEPSPADLANLDRARLVVGRDLLADVPELLHRRATRHLMAQPWRYWRYPLGAATRAEPRLYGNGEPGPPPAAADPELQIKARPATTG